MSIRMKLIDSFRNAIPSLQSVTAVRGYSTQTNAESRVRVELIQALNGRVLEINTRKNLNDDWDCELYIVQDNEALADAIATVLVMKGGA